MMALSATYPEKLAIFLKNYMRDPLYVRLDADSMALVSVKQLLVPVTVQLQQVSNKIHDAAVLSAKETVIDHLLKTVSFNQCLIFCNLHAQAEQITQTFKSKGNNERLSFYVAEVNYQQSLNLDRVLLNCSKLTLLK